MDLYLTSRVLHRTAVALAAVVFAGSCYSTVHAQCAPACQKTNIECLSGQTKATATSVGRVTTPGGGCCTGWVIAAPDLILTNRHCITTNGTANGPVGNVQNMNIIMNLECSACVGGGQKPTTTFNVTSLIHSNAGLDYAILRVNGNIANAFGVLPLDGTVPTTGMPVYEHHHAACQVKGFDSGIVTGPVGANLCLSGTTHEFPVNIIASQGASGSPIFRSSNHAVIGICHCGPACSAGWGVPMSAILPDALPQINAAGGTANVVGGFGCPGGGSCYQVNGSPGCNNASCCATVCAVDPFCCNNTWDQLCVNQAFTLCGNCGASSAGSCYQANSTPGCNSSSCCQQVCVADPFCCNNQWDGLCVGAALSMCGNCGGSNAGSCFQANSTPGCNISSCCQQVCVADPFCCNNQWDGFCASAAATSCGNCGASSAGSCYLPNGTPGCNNASCCQQVCADDPFCCANQWDLLCVSAAFTMCGNCGGSNAGNCYQFNASPGCDNASCCQQVCADDAFCCNNHWDGICANAAFTTCGNCGDSAAGSCYSANGTPGCNNSGCCQTVCLADPFCCNNQWDGICANGAIASCDNCGNPDAGSCYEPNSTKGCNSTNCCTQVCAADPFCCNNSWDSLCSGAAFVTCGNCGNPNAGSCLAPNGTPGCSDSACCEQICVADPFCCNVAWDGICANAAGSICAPSTCVADLTGDGIVGVADLLVLLAAWGPNPGHAADFDGNGSVGVSDLLVLLANWGPCP